MDAKEKFGIRTLEERELEIITSKINKKFDKLFWLEIAKLSLFGTDDNQYIKDCISKYGQPIYRGGK